ncbi:MAG TPA: aquaporin [Thermoleophilaceae bacterium]|jgi:MIP family channel proteins
MSEPPERGPAAYVAEFVGTFALVFFITFTVSLYVTPPVNGIQPFIDFSVIGFVHLLALFMLIQTLAIASGAHFNPAVTLALLSIRQIRVADAVIYWMCQLAGAICAALVTKAILTDEGGATNYGAPAISSHITNFGGICGEAIGTFFLVWAIVGVAVNPRAVAGWAGLVIGGTLGLAVMAIGPVTGGSFNPARAFGPALVGHAFAPSAGIWLLAYVVGPCVGGLAAAIAYHTIYILPGKKGLEGIGPVG